MRGVTVDPVLAVPELAGVFGADDGCGVKNGFGARLMIQLRDFGVWGRGQGGQAARVAQ